MSEKLLTEISSSYSDAMRRLKSILRILGGGFLKENMHHNEVLVLQVMPAKRDKSRFDCVGPLFKYNLYVATINGRSNKESRISRKLMGVDKKITYVNYNASMRTTDKMSGDNAFCPERDMWLAVNMYPEVSLWDIRAYHNNADIYLRTDIKPIPL